MTVFVQCLWPPSSTNCAICRDGYRHKTRNARDLRYQARLKGGREGPDGRIAEQGPSASGIREGGADPLGIGTLAKTRLAEAKLVISRGPNGRGWHNHRGGGGTGGPAPS